MKKAPPQAVVHVSPPRRFNPCTASTIYTEEEAEFLRALDRFKRERKRPFPTWIEVLDVLRALGWRRVPAPDPAA